MAVTKKTNFFLSEEAVEVKATLTKMTTESAYATSSTYSANSEQYPDNLIPFVDKHMNYLRSHPSINPRHYIANLQLKTRIR